MSRGSFSSSVIPLLRQATVHTIPVLEQADGALGVAGRTTTLIRSENRAESAVLGRFAQGLVEHARAGGEPAVIVLSVPDYGGGLVESVAVFFQTYAPTVGWGLVGDSGRVELRIPGLGAWSAAPDRQRTPSKTRPIRLFTDINRRLLKIILLAGRPATEWGGTPESGGVAKAPTTIAELAAAADVSRSSVSRFLAAARAAGFSEPREPGNLRHRRRLLHTWLSVESSSAHYEMGFRGPLGETADELEERAGRVDRWNDWVAHGWLACARMNLLHVDVDYVPKFHASDVDASARQLGLVPELQNPAIVLQQVRFPKSILSPAVQIQDGPHHVDILQAALDVGADPARGHAQAEFLFERILGSEAR